MARRRFAGLLVVMLAVAVALAGCMRRGTNTNAKVLALSISRVYAEVKQDKSGQATMEVDGVITNDSTGVAQLDQLPKLMQDGTEMVTEYEFPYDDPDKLDAGLSLTFHATAALDANEDHAWSFETVEGTEVSGTETTSRIAKVWEDYRASLASDDDEVQEAEAADGTIDPNDGYTLKEVVVLSRHSIRAPMSANGSVLELATNNSWIDWTAPGSELTLRGGAAETLMGQYMRTWLEGEGLIPHNYQPAQGEVRVYANSKQRCMATAQYFVAGMLPVGKVPIETQALFDEMDPVFTPKFTFMSDAYRQAALDQIAERGGTDGMAGVAAGLSDAYALIEDVVDLRNSKGFASGEVSALDTTDTSVKLELGEEPGMLGSLKLACQLSDALVLQYYESPDATAAAFGKELTEDQWRTISSPKDAYGDVLFGSPLVATNIAHPLLSEIGKELDLDGRKFTFLCGHDSNLVSVLAALGVEPYELPGAIEAYTPIGSLVTFEKWEGADGQLYGRVRYLYQSVDQLRNLTLLQNGEEPMMVELSLAGLQKNKDGLYAFDDLRNHIGDAVGAYDDLRDTYADEAELAEAA